MIRNSEGRERTCEPESAAEIEAVAGTDKE